jgi:hypothetical protein
MRRDAKGCVSVWGDGKECSHVFSCFRVLCSSLPLVRTVLTALIAFFPTPGAGAIGSLEYSSHERKEYASRSSEWCCPLCGRSNLDLLADLPPGVLERSGAPKLEREVQEMIDANKGIAAVTVASTPGTPAMGPTGGMASTPQTPLNLAAGRALAEAPSGPTSPTLVRSYSEPLAGTNQVGAGEMTLPTAEPNAATSSSTSSAAAPGPSAAPPAPLVLDEGLRQRQGRVVDPIAAPRAAPDPAAAAPVAPRPAGGQQLSSVTVFLAFLILLILARKLYASSQAKAAFSFDFSQD